MPVHCRMRGFDRDLIRGGHYGQRSGEPHLKAEHMAAPTNAAHVKKTLANLEPSTHGTKQTLCVANPMSASGPIADQFLVLVCRSLDGLSFGVGGARRADDGTKHLPILPGRETSATLEQPAEERRVLVANA